MPNFPANCACLAHSDILRSIGAPSESHTNVTTDSSYPASNVTDGRFDSEWRFANGVTPVGRLRWQLTSAMGQPGVPCVVVVGGLRSLDAESTLKSGTITVKVGTSAGGSETTSVTATLNGWRGRDGTFNIPIVVFGRTTQSGYLTDRFRGYRTLPASTTHIEVSFNDFSGNIAVASVEFMFGHFVSAAVDLSYSLVDDSVLQYSYGGTPYLTRRAPRRKLGFRLINLREAEVWGGTDSIYGTGLTSAVNNRMQMLSYLRYNGIARPYCFIPYIDIANYQVGANDGTIQPVYGLFESPPEVRAMSLTGSEVMFEARGTLTEILRSQTT